MKQFMLIGPIGAGKTSLIQALKGQNGNSAKTQSICFSDNCIDTPGEYIQIPRFYPALMVTAMDALLVIMVQDATDARMAIPPGFAMMFTRDVIGVVTKVDLLEADRFRARKCLIQAGIQEPLFFVSVKSGEGLEPLHNYLTERGCKL